MNITIGRIVKINFFEYTTTIEGIAINVNVNGELSILTPNGKIKNIFCGDCSFS